MCQDEEDGMDTWSRRSLEALHATGAHPGLLTILEGTHGTKRNCCSPAARHQQQIRVLLWEHHWMWIHACSNLEQGWTPWPHQLGFSALKFSATHLKKAAAANNRARASNTNPWDNEPGGGRRWALSEEGAVLLLERPKRAINPQIQRRTQALSSRRKAWDVSAGRTNHAASPAEVASSAKPRSSPGYYTQILSICSRPAAGRARRHPCRHREPPDPPHRNTGHPAFMGECLCACSLPNPTEDLPPGIPLGAGGCVPPSRVWLRYYSKPQTKSVKPSTSTSLHPSTSRGCQPCLPTCTLGQAPMFQKSIKREKSVAKRRRRRASATREQPQTLPSLMSRKTGTHSGINGNGVRGFIAHKP